MFPVIIQASNMCWNCLQSVIQAAIQGLKKKEIDQRFLEIKFKSTQSRLLNYNKSSSFSSAYVMCKT